MSTPNALQLRFQEKLHKFSDQHVLAALNREGLGQGWTSARAAYIWALREEMIGREWDFSAIAGGGDSFYLRYEVRLIHNKIEIVRDQFHMRGQDKA